MPGRPTRPVVKKIASRSTTTSPSPLAAEGGQLQSNAFDHRTACPERQIGAAAALTAHRGRITASKELPAERVRTSARSWQTAAQPLRRLRALPRIRRRAGEALRTGRGVAELVEEMGPMTREEAG